MHDRHFDNHKRLYVLEEVFYNIASDYFLAYALLAPLLRANADLSNYF